MDIKPIQSEADYDRALRRVESLLDCPKVSARNDELDILATLIEAYERQHYPIDRHWFPNLHFFTGIKLPLDLCLLLW